MERELLRADLEKITHLVCTKVGQMVGVCLTLLNLFLVTFPNVVLRS